MPQLSVLLEGWRFIPHSYAIINQWQCLELLERPGVEVSMRDLPYFHAGKWRPVRGLLPKADEERIARVPPPRAGARRDATLRISVPVRFRPARSGRTFVLGTADFGWLPRVMIGGGRDLKDAHAGTDVVIVTPSEWSRRGLLRGGADPARVTVLPHGVSPGLFRPPSAQERAALRAARRWQDKFVFLNVSAMSLSKGTDLMLKAFARVAARHPHVRLLLKGSDQVYDSKQWLDRWWQEKLTAQERAACEGRIAYIGASLPFAKVAELFRAADAYLTPYRSEAFNMPALEAAACGLPLICTAGGPTDDFTTDAFARRIPAGVVPRKGKESEEVQFKPDPEALEQAMLAIVEDAAFRSQARLAGPQHVAARFTWAHVVDELLRLFRA